MEPCPSHPVFATTPVSHDFGFDTAGLTTYDYLDWQHAGYLSLANKPRNLLCIAVAFVIFFFLFLFLVHKALAHESPSRVREADARAAFQRERAEVAEGELEKKEEAFETLCDEHEELKAENEGLERKDRDLEAKNGTLIIENENQRDVIEAQRLVIDHLIAQLDAMTKDKAAVEKQNDEHTRDIGQYSDEAVDLRRQITQKDRTIEDQANTIKDKDDELTTANEDIDILTDTKDELEQEVTDLETRNGTLTEEKDSLAGDFEAFKQASGEESTKSKARVETLTTENGQLKSDFDASTKEVASLRTELKILDDSSSKDKTDFEARVEGLMKQLDAEKGFNETLTTEKEAAEARSTAMKNDKTALEKDVAYQKERTTEVEKELAESEKSNSILSSQNTSLRTKNDTLTKEIEELNAEKDRALQGKAEELKQVDERSSTLSSTNGGLQSKILGLEKRFGELTTEIAKSKKKCDGLNHKAAFVMNVLPTLVNRADEADQLEDDNRSYEEGALDDQATLSNLRTINNNLRAQNTQLSQRHQCPATHDRGTGMDPTPAVPASIHQGTQTSTTIAAKGTETSTEAGSDVAALSEGAKVLDDKFRNLTAATNWIKELTSWILKMQLNCNNPGHPGPAQGIRELVAQYEIKNVDFNQRPLVLVEEAIMEADERRLSLGQAFKDYVWTIVGEGEAPGDALLDSHHSLQELSDAIADRNDKAECERRMQYINDTFNRMQDVLHAFDGLWQIESLKDDDESEEKSEDAASDNESESGDKGEDESDDEYDDGKFLGGTSAQSGNDGSHGEKSQGSGDDSTHPDRGEHGEEGGDSAQSEHKGADETKTRQATPLTGSSPGTNANTGNPADSDRILRAIENAGRDTGAGEVKARKTGLRTGPFPQEHANDNGPGDENADTGTNENPTPLKRTRVRRAAKNKLKFKDERFGVTEEDWSLLSEDQISNLRIFAHMKGLPKATVEASRMVRELQEEAEVARGERKAPSGNGYDITLPPQDGDGSIPNPTPAELLAGIYPRVSPIEAHTLLSPLQDNANRTAANETADKQISQSGPSPSENQADASATSPQADLVSTKEPKEVNEQASTLPDTSEDITDARATPKVSTILS